MATARDTLARTPAAGALPKQRVRERAVPEVEDLLGDAVKRARRSGRGVLAVRRGARVVSARPSRTVPPGVIQFTASPSTAES